MKHLSTSKIRTLLPLFTLLLLTACHNRPQGVPSDADTLDLHHAQHLMLIEHDDHTEVQIRNPWDEDKLLQRFTIPHPSDASTDEPSGAFKRIAVFTTTHACLLEELGSIDALAGICETEYVSKRVASSTWAVP